MIEIDHNQSPPPLPAQPMLASDLFLLEQKQRGRFTGHSRLEGIKTDCPEVDELLGAGLGGLERGIVLGISAGDEGRLISLNLLTTILISHLSHPSKPPYSIATIIDTTSSFPLSLLAKILKSRLISSHLSTLASSTTKAQNQTANEAANHAVRKRGNEKGQLSAEEEKEVDEKVNRCLEMVALSRVFDIEGLWEVLGEIDVSPQDTSSSSILQQDHREVGETRSQLEKENDEPKHEAKETRKEERTEIEDSEDDDDLLLSLPSPQKPIETSPAKARAKNEAQTDIPKRGSLSGEHNQTKAGEGEQGTEIIIVDNMTHLISELFGRKEKNDAHQLLTLLARHIHTLSKTKNILTILHNTTTPSKPSFNPSYPTSKEQKTTPNPSIFPSAPSKPSLGQLFASFTSLHLLISQLPKQRDDAELLYAQDPDLPAPAADSINYCYVLEILKDETPNLRKESGGKGRRFGAREQSWTAVEVNSEGTGMTGVFQSKGDVRRMNLAKIRDGLASVGGVRDVGRMAKMQGGFGGRRV